MARFISDQNLTAFYYESGTYATASGTAQWLGDVQSMDPSDNTGVFSVRYQGTGTRDVNQFVDGPLSHQGTVSFYPTDWKSLLFALGSNVDAGSPSPYTHVVSPTNSASGNAMTSGADNPFVSYSLYNSEKAIGNGLNFNRQYNGCVTDTWTLNVPQGDLITVDVDWIAQSVTYSSGAQPALTDPATRPFVYSDATLFIPSGAANIVTQAKNITLSISNNIDAKTYVNGSRVIGTPIATNRDYNVDVNIDANSEWSKVLYDQYFLGGSTFNAMLQVNASTGSRDCFIVMSGCKMNPLGAPTSVEGVNEINYTFKPQTMIVNINDAIEKYNGW